jgi:hypothetical protein
VSRSRPASRSPGECGYAARALRTEPAPGEHGDFFRYTFRELCSIATPYATRYEAIMLRPA